MARSVKASRNLKASEIARISLSVFGGVLLRRSTIQHLSRSTQTHSSSAAHDRVRSGFAVESVGCRLKVPHGLARAETPARTRGSPALPQTPSPTFPDAHGLQMPSRLQPIRAS